VYRAVLRNNIAVNATAGVRGSAEFPIFLIFVRRTRYDAGHSRATGADARLLIPVERIPLASSSPCLARLRNEVAVLADAWVPVTTARDSTSAISLDALIKTCACVCTHVYAVKAKGTSAMIRRRSMLERVQ